VFEEICLEKGGDSCLSHASVKRKLGGGGEDTVKDREGSPVEGSSVRERESGSHHRQSWRLKNSHEDGMNGESCTKTKKQPATLLLSKRTRKLPHGERRVSDTLIQKERGCRRVHRGGKGRSKKGPPLSTQKRYFEGNYKSKKGR